MRGNMRKAPQIHIRAAQEDDLVGIEVVHATAFGRDEEAHLPNAVICAGHEVISIVAEATDRHLVGHALFTALGGLEGALALGPVAVIPQFQNAGVGTRMIEAGLEHARSAGWRSVFVLGEPAYYARFGFRDDLARGAVVPWKGPSFQGLELVPGSLRGWSGLLRYPDEFYEL